MSKSITRRIIALMYATAGCVVISWMALEGVGAAFTALIAIVSVITGFYFGTKSNTM